MKTLLKMIAVSMLALAPVSASAEDICDLFLPDEEVVSTYKMTIGPGTYAVGGIIKPYVKKHVLTATIYQIEEELILTSTHGFEMTFKDVEFDERDWKFKKGGDFGMGQDDSDIALSAGCTDINQLPRLQATGNGSYFTNKGAKVPTFMKLFALSRVQDGGIRAIGGMLAKSQGVVFKLRVSLTPN